MKRKEITLIRTPERDRPSLATFRCNEEPELTLAVSREGAKNCMLLGRESPLIGIKHETPYPLRKITPDKFEISETGYIIEPAGRNKRVIKIHRP